ncbi:uncharacterized protein LOC144903494 isoform X5 [Branchiostoma floridae x Branchiostoma belcheri]
MSTEPPRQEVRGVERKIKQSQGGDPANSDSHVRRDATTLQETLLAMHKLFLEKKEDTSREFGKLLQVAQEQADVSEDELVRSSFRNAELEMLLADEKLQADDANAQHERELSESHADLEMAIYELQQEKNRCAQKNLQIEDLKAQVAVLKTGGACFGSREEARCHISALEAEELAFRIAELEVLLEEQRNEKNMLRDLLKNVPQTQMSEEEDDIEQQHNFLPEYLLTSCPSPSKGGERADIEQQGDSFLPEYLLTSCPSPSKGEERADIEQQGDSFLPEYLLASCPSPNKEEETADIKQHNDSFLPENLLASCPSPSKEEGTADIEQEGDLFLPEYLLASCPSPSKEEGTADIEQEGDLFLPEYLLASCPSPSKEEGTADIEQEGDLFLPEYLLASCPSPSKEEEPADIEQEGDLFLPEYLLASCPSPSKEEEPADIEQEGDLFLPEYLLASWPSPSKEEEPADIEQEGDSLLPEYLLASCPFPSKEEETADIEQEDELFLPEYLLTNCPSPSKEEQIAEIEQHDDSFLPEYLLASCPSPNKEEQIADIEQQGITLPVSKPHEDCLEDHSDIAPFLEELLINSRSPLRTDSVSALDQESQDILRLSELLSSAASLESSCDGSQLHLPDPKMANPQASVKEETQAPEGVKCGGLLQSILEEAQSILSLSASSAVTPDNDKTEPIKEQRGQVVKTPLPTGKTYWTTVEPLQGSCCYTTTYISSNKDITVYQQL